MRFVIPANETFACRRGTFTPTALPHCLGILEIRESRKEGGKETVSRYAVQELATRAEGRGFRLTKPGGAELYFVEIRYNNYHLCDCTGFLRYGDCKHTRSLAAVVRAGQEAPRLAAGGVSTAG